MMTLVRLICRRSVLLVLLSAGLGALIFSLPGVSLAQQPEPGVRWDQAVPIPAPEESSAWFPDLAVDSQGHVHVVWVQTKRLETISPKTNSDLEENLYYSMWDGQQWLQPNDLVPIVPDIVRNAIAVDKYDRLHLLFDWKPGSGFDLYYKQVPADSAISAAAWTAPHLVSSRGQTYMSDIAVAGDTLHIIYDDAGAAGENVECAGCADIYYRQSTDWGVTWSTPMALFPTGTGSFRPQIEIDRPGTIHVTWDEGFDRRTGRGDFRYGVYMYSAEGGQTWSAPTLVSYPNSTNLQLSVGSNGQGGVMLVWRTTSPEYPHIYYMWSIDQGASWSPPQAIPKIMATKVADRFDLYDLATDSAGHIHLLAVGRLSDAQVPDGLYHLEWDGRQWSAPGPVYEGKWYPAYPHLVIERGNQLHATWHISIGDDVTPKKIWYAHGQSLAPAEASVALPASTPTVVPTPLPASSPTPRLRLPTPTPTLDPNLTRVTVPAGATASIYTETDDLLLLVQSLIPAAVVIVIVVMVMRFWRR